MLEYRHQSKFNTEIWERSQWENTVVLIENRTKNFFFLLFEFSSCLL